MHMIEFFTGMFPHFLTIYGDLYKARNILTWLN